MQIAPFNIPLQAIEDSVTDRYGVHLFVLRTDLNHPHISGNKLFKLRYNLLEAQRSNIKTLLTFGGAYSNHIAATAAAGKEYGYKTIGIIRGEEYPELNPTLQFAVSCGMRLHYVSRNLYRNKGELYNYVNGVFGEENFYLVPEGGNNFLGVKGCKEITSYITTDFDIVCCACGTGATMAGITLSLKAGQSAIGFQILKGQGYIKKEIERWIHNERVVNKNFVEPIWHINEDYHFGKYARIRPELVSFVEEFNQNNATPLDYVYTGKMMFGIYDLIKRDFFKGGRRIVAIHTGGLQGNAGFGNRLLSSGKQ